MSEHFHLWLIPLTPLLGAAAIGVWGHHRGERAVPAIAVSSAAISFLLALRAFLVYPGNPIVEQHYGWISAGSFQVRYSIYYDALTAVMSLLITGIGLIIHWYVTISTSRRARPIHFLVLINLSMSSLLIQALAGDYLLLLSGWAGAGLCAYFLHGRDSEQASDAGSGKLVFLANRFGELAIIAAVLLVFRTFGGLSFQEIIPATKQLTPELDFWGPLTQIALLLLVAAASKFFEILLFALSLASSRARNSVIPLSHATLMATAGLYLIARSSAIFLHAPHAQRVAAIAGSGIALYGVAVALSTSDIRRILTYLSISQTGYILLAYGVAAFGAASFHLATSTTFITLLLLGTDRVIRALSGEPDIRRMGGLRARLPRTSAAFLTGCAAISAVPGLSGFFSMNQILLATYSSPHGGLVFWLIGLITTALTAYCMFRVYFLTFQENPGPDPQVPSTAIPQRGIEATGQARESDDSTAAPLMVLAIVTALIGWMGFPEASAGNTSWSRFLYPVFSFDSSAPTSSLPIGQGHALALMAILILASLLGLAVSWWRFHRGQCFAELQDSPLHSIRQALTNNFYLGSVFRQFLATPVLILSRDVLWRAVDQWLIDSSVLRWIRCSQRLGMIASKLHSGNIRSYAARVLIGAVLLISFMVAKSG